MLRHRATCVAWRQHRGWFGGGSDAAVRPRVMCRRIAALAL
ncbi:hypothetical protein L665_03575 [Ralstonia solanacearum SD54]|nr:hypothetical protein L665_03575 [Ralstonia solanacearum SD54]